MTELITDWYPLPEVAGDHGNWEPLVVQTTPSHTNTNESRASRPKSSKSSLLSSTSMVARPSSQTQRSTYPTYTSSIPQPRRTSHTHYHTHSLSPVPLSLNFSPVVLEKHLSPPSLGSEATNCRQTHMNTAICDRIHNTSGPHPSKLLYSTTSATKLVPTPSLFPSCSTGTAEQSVLGGADLTITSLLSTSARSEAETGVDPQSTLGGRQETSHVGSESSGTTLTSHKDSLGYSSSTAVSNTASSATLPSRPSRGLGESNLPVGRSLTLAELDILWRKFLASSLAGQGEERRTNHQWQERMAGGETSTPEAGKLHQSAPVVTFHCTCHKATDIPPDRGSTPANTRAYGSRAQTGTRGEGAQISGTHHEPRLVHSTRETPRAEFGKEYHYSLAISSGPNRTGPKTSLAVTGAVGSRDRSMQTTPSLLVPHPTFSAQQRPGVSFSVGRQPAKASSTPTLSQLTLQEALRAFRPEFIHRSEQRQQRVREGCGKGWGQQLRPPPVGGQPAGGSERTPRFFFVDASNCRPKMSQREMYEQSKRYWHRLPEVRRRAVEERRRAEAATNRLRVKLYQKEVLARRRRRRSKRT